MLGINRYRYRVKLDTWESELGTARASEHIIWADSKDHARSLAVASQRDLDRNLANPPHWVVSLVEKTHA